MTDDDLAVDVHGLTKRFGHTQALDGLDITVPRGTVTGFLGPNGAGKSTTIRILLGLMRADGGRAVLLGGDPWTDAVRLHRRLAYVPGDVTLWPNLTGGEAIDVLTGISGTVDRRRKAELLERFRLDPTKKARTYSKGNRQKVALVAALGSDAELLILDEPTSGLDPLMEQAFQDSVREATAAGRSVLLSSHIFAEVERLADRVTIIRDGVTVESGTLDELRRLARTRVRVRLGRQEEARVALGRLPGVHDMTVEDGVTGFAVDDADLPAVLAAIAPLEPHALVANPPSLEEIFLRDYGGGADAAGRTDATAGSPR